MRSNTHIRAILQALLVTFLWSTSWVLIKLGLKASLPAVTFAGLRYSLAFACLLPLVLANPNHRRLCAGFTRRTWAQLALLGLVFYTLTQGAQFVGLEFLPAATLTLLLNFSPMLVALFSGAANQENPSRLQWGGMLLAMLGALAYFLPFEIPAGQVLGFTAALIGVLANAGSSLLGRHVNHRTGLPPLVITTISMGIGGLLLLGVGAVAQGFGRLDGVQWLIIAWLAVVNTALAFTLWNHTLRTLTAVESSVINNTMLPQIAILAWIFLGESLDARQILGLGLVAAGTLIVQLRRDRGKV
jgi:drug/metabolite transporter (DMT)-like permease